MPADPTIPELVARLRELHNARRYPTETLATTIRDDQSAQVYATSIGPMRAVRPVAETTVDYADLIAETLNALPAILDALDRLTELYDVTQARLEAFEEQEPDARTRAEWVATAARLWFVSCEYCGSTNWNVTATLIGCRDCGVVYDRVNSGWVLDLDTVPVRKYDLQGLDPHEL